MNNFGEYITPIRAMHLHSKSNCNELRKFKYWDELHRQKDKLCPICQTEKIWKYGGCGMCFSCTTGEYDASNDYELK